jgi:hypothetical protein
MVKEFVRREAIGSLRDALREVPDPRRGNRSWPLSTLLTLVCMGLLAGRKNLAEIYRFRQFLTRQQRGWLGFLPKGNRRTGTAGAKLPGALLQPPEATRPRSAGHDTQCLA